MLETIEYPDQFIIADTTTKVSLRYEDWQAKNQAILGWLMNSISIHIATQLFHCETSKQLWEKFKALLVHTRSIIILGKMKNLTEKLKLAGSSISNSDLVIHTLNGLDYDYNPVVTKLH